MPFELLDPAASSLDHRPVGPWTFDVAVVSCFEDMLSRSIPQYEVMRDLCFTLGRGFVRPQTTVLDLGCSLGQAMAPFVWTFGPLASYVGVDASPAMVEAATRRWAAPIEAGLVQIRQQDLRFGVIRPASPASLILCVLTLMFVPVETRPAVLRMCYDTLAPGGALLLVEKLQLGPALERACRERYEAHKRQHGYSQAAIDAKRQSLAGVLEPLTAVTNEALLARAGFDAVDRVWQWCQFALWIAVKGPR